MICPAISIWSQRLLTLVFQRLESLTPKLWFCRHDHKIAAQQTRIRGRVSNSKDGRICVEEISLRGRITHPPVERGLRIAAVSRMQCVEIFEHQRGFETGCFHAALRRGTVQANMAEIIIAEHI